eukprot:ctg_2773.g552
MPRAEIEQLDVFVCGDCQAEHSGEQSAAAKRAIVEQFQREHRQWQERQRQARQQRRTAPGEDQAEGGHSRGTNGSEPSVADAPSPHNEAPSPSRKRPRRERPAQAPLSVAVAPSAAAIAEARTKARQLLAQVLHAQLAESIEHALYLCLGERVNDEYRQRLRNLVSNLRDGRNPELRQAVLRGDIAPEALCRMNSDELASEQMRARREQQLSRAERLRVIESAEQVGLVFKAQAHVQEPSLMAEAATARDKLWASPPTAADETTASVKKDEEEERPATPPPSKMAPSPREPLSGDETSSAGAASPTRSELGQKTSPRRTEAVPLRFPQPPPPTFTAAPAHQFDESAFHEASQQLPPPPSPADISASSASSSSTPSSVAAGRDLAADHKAHPGAAPPSPATTDDAATTAPLWHGTLRMPALGTCRVAFTGALERGGAHSTRRRGVVYSRRAAALPIAHGAGVADRAATGGGEECGGGRRGGAASGSRSRRTGAQRPRLTTRADRYTRGVSVTERIFRATASATSGGIADRGAAAAGPGRASRTAADRDGGQ